MPSPVRRWKIGFESLTRLQTNKNVLKMRLIEILIDKIIELPLLEMAIERKMAHRDIHGISFELTNHIIKTLVIPESGDREHWKNEIDEWLQNIQRIILKPKNKRLSQTQYFEWLVREPEYVADERWIRLLKHRYKDENFVVSYDLNETLQHILYRLCVDLGNNQFESIENYL